MPKAVDQRPTATRARILGATVELIAEIGWQQLTTRRIAARAGVNQALVHYHFGSMDALLRQAMIAALEREMAEPTAGLLQSESPGEGIRQLSDWLRAFDPGSPTAVLSAEALAYATRDPQVRRWTADLLGNVHRSLEDSVTLAQKEGRLRSDVPAAGVALLTAALVDGLIFHRLIDPGLDVEELALTLDVALASGQWEERD